MIQLTTLGPVRCLLQGEDLRELPHQRMRFALLVYLAMEREVARESAYNLIWANRTDARARCALNQTVYELRRQLGYDCIETHAHGLRVADWVTLDANESTAAAQQSDWARVLELYDGDFLGAFTPPCKPFEFWVDRRRNSLAALHRKARRHLIAQSVAAGNLTTAIALTRRWLDLAPAEDEAHHRLIELLAQTGERAEALQHFASYERQLREEQLEPLHETKQLSERIRAGAFVSRVGSGYALATSAA
jgi:DNA-binding SARP family transcriptional activator